MRGLYGDFGTMPLKDLVVYLGNKRASGVMTLELDAIRKSVTLHEGLVVSAGSNRAREFLGQFLINMGQLTEDQFAVAYQEQQQTRVMMGRILVRDGLVKESAVLNALNLKFRETLLSAFGWEQGAFSFAPSETPMTDAVEVKVDLLDIAKEGEFRETAWEAIRAVFPSGRVRLALSRQNLAEPPRPGSLDEKLFALMDEGATVDDMVLALHATDFFFYQRLYALYRLEAIAVIGEAPANEAPPKVPQVVGAEPSSDEVFRHAQAFLELGNFEDAVVCARRALEIQPSPGVSTFLKNAEGKLLERLRAILMEGDRIPSLLVSPAQLKSMPLAAPEKYLLSRIDSTRTVRAIVQVSPLSELEALRAFRGFLDNQLVKLISPMDETLS